jgi:NADPH:quinone reductase-like Zn-dependent oxidoreductase
MVIDRFGGSEEFHEIDRPAPVAGPGEVLIRMAYASINPADWKGRAGLLPHLGPPYCDFPLTMGMDGSGIVAGLGEGTEGFAVGERVVTLSGLGLGMHGTYAEYAVAPVQRVAHLPARLNLAEGGTLPIAAASAANCIIDVAGVKPGDVVFLNGGAGSVGTFAIQYLKHLGARVAATCSTRNLDHVAGFGADRVIDYTSEDLGAALSEWAPDGLHAVIDAVGQHSLPASTPGLIRRGGTLVVITNLLTGPEAFDLDLANARGVRVIDNVTASRVADMRTFQVSAFRQILAAIDAGAVDPPPFEIVPLAEVGPAQDRVQAGHVRGKILLEIGGDLT